MSDPAAQPWWADVQHLRPREAGGNRPVRWDGVDATPSPAEPAAVATALPREPGRFTRAAVADSPLETAVAVAIADDLPRLQDIDWHDFIDSHQELDDVVGGDVWLEEPAKPAGRRTVEISGQVDRATAQVDPAVAASVAGRRRTPPAPGERFHAHPDRVALWAFLMGVVLMIVAALSAPEADAAVRLMGG
jgi:hypothetical protein